MTLEAIQSFISTCGFPIACCIFLVYQNMRQEKAHKEQISELKEAIELQTKAINEIIEMVKKER